MSLHVIDKEKNRSYEIITLLGQGGFGKVYHARERLQNDEIGLEVAIKALDIQKMLEARMKDRVNEEVTIHSQLEHENIVKFLNVFQDSDNVYLVLEYCPNGDLSRYIKQKGRLSEMMARKVFRQIVNGVLYLHKHLIVHRDLTLANILLNEHFDVKISDFGLATKMKMKNETHLTMCGTPISIAPEIISRKPHGPEADVWSLGCILYTLLVGQSPFETEGVRNTMKRVVNHNPVLPSYLGHEAQDLITQMLQKNPLSRIQLIHVLDHPYCQPNKSCISGTWDSGMCSTMSSSPYIPESRILEFKNTRDSSTSANPSSNSIEKTIHCYHPKSWSEASHTKKQISGLPILRSLAENKENQLKSLITPSLSSPIKAHRLRPTSKSHLLKCGSASILPSSKVQLKFNLGKKNSYVETITVSPNGQTIWIESPKVNEEYTYTSLPEKYWQKYNYVARYVKFVREKTPKITYYSDFCKCYLMENSPVSSFEATFYFDKTKIAFSSTSGINIYKNGDKIGSYSYPLSLNESNSNYDSLKHFQDCHTKCKRIEDLLQANERSIGSQIFPIIIGRKPNTVSTDSPSPSVRTIKSFTSDRTTRVDFEDNTRIELGPDDDVKYVKNGIMCSLSKTNLPDEVRSKLSLIDQHIQELRKKPPNLI